jgi:hypothetical protein
LAILIAFGTFRDLLRCISGLQPLIPPFSFISMVLMNRWKKKEPVVEGWHPVGGGSTSRGAKKTPLQCRGVFYI